MLNVSNCIFESSRKDYAIRLGVSESAGLKMFVSDCEFSFNNGSIYIFASTDRVTDCHPPGGVNLLISDTLFQNDWRADFSGGALVSGNNISLTVTGCQFKNNTALAGSAIYAQSSQLIVDKTQFYKNTASYYGSALLIADSSINMSNCTIMDNSVERGALYTTRNSLLTFSDTVFQGNRASMLGGALYIDDGVGAVEILSMYDCQFSNNSASDSGGAIYAIMSKSMSMYNCQFNNNSASVSGGAIYARISRLTCYNSEFTYNKAGDNGGAIYCYATFAEVRNGSAISNSADNGNGGFAYLAEKCTLHSYGGLTDFYTISSNTATNGGAIYAEHQSGIGVGNSILVNNAASSNGGALYLADSTIAFTGFSKTHCI